MRAVSGRPVDVLTETSWIGDRQLRGQVLDDALRNIDRTVQERAEKAYGAQLQRVAESVVVTPAGGNRDEVCVVEIEEACQLLRRRFAGEAAIVLGLYVGKKVNWHPFIVRGRGFDAGSEMDLLRMQSLKKAGCPKIFRENASGANRDDLPAEGELTTN